MKYKIDGVIYDPILMGDVDDFYEACDKDTCCSDCGAHMGEQHLNGCDCERCPKCLGQIISCSCHDSDIEEVTDEEE